MNIPEPTIPHLPDPDCESEIDATIAELREQLTDEDRGQIDEWLNTEIDPETSDRMDAEIEAFFDESDAQLLAGLKITTPPYGAEDPDGDSPSDAAGDAETGGADGSPRAVSLADIYAALGIGPDEHVSICYIPIGEKFRCQGIYTAADAPAVAAGLTGDVYFGVQPIDLPLRKYGPRGGPRGVERDVTRAVGLYTDLDVKPDACLDLDIAHAIIDDVSAVLGTRPVVVIFSGHGLQPIWKVVDCTPVDGRVLLRRFGRLVKAVAKKHDVKVDSVFDLTRILRVPGMLNHKDDPPVPTSATLDTGGALTVAEISERLDETGVYEYDDDREVLGEVISDSDTWPFAGGWCQYAKKVTAAWATDTQKGGRHQMMLDNLVRLAAMWRYGCIPEEAAMHAVFETIYQQLVALRAETMERVKPYEIHSGWEWAVERVSRKTDEQVADELGNHSHDAADSGQFFRKGVGLLALKLANAVMRSVTCGFNDTTERFYVYDGGVWRPNRSRIEAEIAALLGNRYRSSHANNALALIRFSDLARITCDPLPRYINVRNGMVDWATGSMIAHDPDYLSTVQLPVEYDPDAWCPAFDRWLSEVLAADCIEFIWEIIGYTMYSGNPLHIAVLLYGKGRNGKGTLLRVLKALLSEHNCSAVGLHELTENRFRTATLYGKLANLAGDLDARWVANTATFKAITGGDLIQGEHKYGPAFDFTPWALPIYSANKAFGSSDSSEGWVSRWVVVPFPNTFAGREDRSIESVLRTDGELRGILRKGIEALPALLARGCFLEPESVTEAKAAFIAASDVVRSWIDEACTLDVDAWEPRTKLYNAYWSHPASEGSKQLSAREFYNRVEQVSGIVAATRRGERGFKGIRLGAGGGEPALRPKVKNDWRGA